MKKIIAFVQEIITTAVKILNNRPFKVVERTQVNIVIKVLSQNII